MGLDGIWLYYLFAALTGLGSLILLIQILPGSSYLRLNKNSFERSILFRKYITYWKDVKDFGIMTINRAGIHKKFIGFNYIDDYDRSKFKRSLDKEIAGFEAGLTDTYGMKSEELLSLMIEYWNQNKSTEQVA